MTKIRIILMSFLFLGGCGRIGFEAFLLPDDKDAFADLTDAAAGSVVDVNTKINRATDADINSEPDTDADTSTGTNTYADAGDDSGTDAGSDSGTDAGSDSGTDAGSDSGTDAGSDSGTDAGSDSGTDAGDYRVSADMTFEEAIDSANASPGAQTITMEPGIDITLTTTLPTITETVTIIGSGNTVDGSALHGNADCLIIAASNVLVSSLDFYGCVSHPISIVSGGDNQITNCTFRDNADSISCASGIGNNIFGPNNEVTGVTEIGIESYCPGDQIIQNRIYYPGNLGIAVSADNIAIFGNLCVGGTGGILLGNFATNCSVWHNTFVKTEYAAINASPGVTFEIWNNIFAFNSTWGITNSPGAITSNNNNLWSNNIGGDCDNCTLGSEAVTSDPLFVDRNNDNYLLQPTSPAMNAGAESSWDVNGSSAGLFNGSAPDIGYSENE